MKQRGFRGFTLVEMLVVIVIILVLASIIYPTIIGVRSKASQVKCMSHMRQIGMAMQLYLGDNDDKFPMGAYEIEVTDNGATASRTVRVYWEDILFHAGYLKTGDVLICPSATNNDYRSSYGVNRWVMGWTKSVKMDAIPYPSNTVMITEKSGYDWVAWEPSERDNPFYYPLEPRHSRQLNVLFCDQHVKKIAVGEFIQGDNILWRF
jgi:prepilin-type N-terminal cleavage/methylation domain-containing protein/prepilin-type processing-associated H-X9-DG protein